MSPDEELEYRRRQLTLCKGPEYKQTIRALKRRIVKLEAANGR